MSEEKRMLGNYEVVNSIYIGDKEVVFGVDKSDKYPFLVSYCDYHNPFGVPWATESVGCDDYLEAMGISIQRVQSQIEQTKSELSKFAFDNTVFTKDHCIPDKRSSSIVGKVVVINAEPKRPSAYSVSKASDDFPDPDKPVTTTSLLRGISTLMFLRLLTRAPFILILETDIILFD